MLPLHGDLTPAEQDRAVQPSSERKLILATNVAESSVTVEGVTAVIDSGLARIATYSPWTGLPTLQISRHLLLREGFKSLLDDGARFARKLALEGGPQS
jgi:HrpA-like RNA helicase